MPKRLYTRRITLLLCIHVNPLRILCYGTTIRANLLEEVEKIKKKHQVLMVNKTTKFKKGKGKKGFKKDRKGGAAPGS